MNFSQLFRSPAPAAYQLDASGRTGSWLGHPLLLYCLVWGCTLLLASAGWAVFMDPITSGLLVLFAGNMLLAVLATLVATRIAPTRNRKDAAVVGLELSVLRNMVGAMLPIWVFGCLVNVAYSGGLPIIWLLQGDELRTYADFGIPTVSGFLNAIGLFSANAVLLDVLVGGNRKRLWVIPAVIAFQILTINRGGMVATVLELLGVYLVIGRISLGTVFRAALIVVLLALAFGIVGDARVGERGKEALLGMMTEDGRAVFEPLPSAAWWSYLYATVGTVNLNAAVEHQQALGYPYWSVLGLFPTVIRGMIYDFSVYELKYPLDMVNPVFNVFTLYAGYLADYGIAGCLAVTAVFIGFATWFYLHARLLAFWAVLAYAVFFQVVILSVFWDNLMGWVSLFQVALAFIYRNKLRGHFVASREPRP